jgi:ABC-type uncharacterized transport system YnjBCD ATPase subunit
VRRGGYLNRESALAALEEVRCPGSRSDAPGTVSTLERIRVTLRVALNAAVRDGLIEHNPARHLELLRPRKGRAVVWTEDQVEQ